MARPLERINLVPSSNGASNPKSYEAIMEPAFQEIVQHFEFDGDFISASPYGTGHINDTYEVRFHGNNQTDYRYILQRINHNVFKNPEGLMSNVVAVTAHLRQKIITAGGDPQREALNLIPAVDGNSFIRTDDGNYWRAFVFIEDAHTYERVDSLDHVYHAGKAFGNFQNLLSDFPPDQLTETIPDFHHTRKRFEAFNQAAEQDVFNRACLSKPEIEFVMLRGDSTSTLIDLLTRGELPSRITHNDTKFNNVMIDDETQHGLCVIDLDTVMPGLSLYDFGDSIRSMANTAAEDEPGVSKVQLDLQVFDSFTHGYLDMGRSFLTSTEIEYLPAAAVLMTLENGMRFLTDYLQGDTYFKIHRENHNLERCRTQLKLVQAMEEQIDDMKQVVEKRCQSRT